MGDNNHWSEERWQRLIEQWCADFGHEAAAKIAESSIIACGGERLTLPSVQDLQRRERNRRICNAFTGDNIHELTERFELKERQIRRILLQQRFIDRGK